MIIRARHSGKATRVTRPARTHRELGARKPDPAFFAPAARRIGAHPAAILFIDDSTRNIATAREADLAAEQWTLADGHDTLPCPDPAEAAKCRQLIRTGHPGFDLAPLVIDSGGPPGRDGDGGPYLTVFAASMGGIDMASEPGARTVLDAIASPEISVADRLRMTAIIMRLATDAARQILEAMMKTSEYEKTFVEQIHEQGIAEGKAVGIAEGEARGEAKGEGKAVLKILGARRLAPSKEQRQRVMSCTDAEQLELWLDRAITATTVDEVFAD